MFSYVLIGIGLILLVSIILKGAGVLNQISYTMLPRTRLIISILVFGVAISCLVIGVITL